MPVAFVFQVENPVFRVLNDGYSICSVLGDALSDLAWNAKSFGHDSVGMSFTDHIEDCMLTQHALHSHARAMSCVFREGLSFERMQSSRG